MEAERFICIDCNVSWLEENDFDKPCWACGKKDHVRHVFGLEISSSEAIARTREFRKTLEEIG